MNMTSWYDEKTGLIFEKSDINPREMTHEELMKYAQDTFNEDADEAERKYVK